MYIDVTDSDVLYVPADVLVVSHSSQLAGTDGQLAEFADRQYHAELALQLMLDATNNPQAVRVVAPCAHDGGFKDVIFVLNENMTKSISELVTPALNLAIQCGYAHVSMPMFRQGTVHTPESDLHEMAAVMHSYIDCGITRLTITTPHHEQLRRLLPVSHAT